MEKVEVILIIAAAGNLQAGLQVLFTNLSDVETLVANDGKTALRAIDRHNPTLVIFDNDVTNITFLLQGKRRLPNVCFLSLVNQVQEREEVLKKGVDVALIKGILPSKLFLSVKEQLTNNQIKKSSKITARMKSGYECVEYPVSTRSHSRCKSSG